MSRLSSGSIDEPTLSARTDLPVSQFHPRLSVPPHRSDAKHHAGDPVWQVCENLVLLEVEAGKKVWERLLLLEFAHSILRRAFLALSESGQFPDELFAQYENAIRNYDRDPPSPDPDAKHQAAERLLNIGVAQIPELEGVAEDWDDPQREAS